MDVVKVCWISAGVSSFIAGYLERDIGHSILKECYLDELDPKRGRNKEIMPQCDIFCMLNIYNE